MSTRRRNVMSCPQDLIRVLSGDVRVSPEELTADDRVRLFWLAAKPIGDLLEHRKSMYGFNTWERESITGGSSLGDKSLLRYSLELPGRLRPLDAYTYSLDTRIHVLTADYCRLPNYDLPENGKWEEGDNCLVMRICVTNGGAFFLEEYLVKVVQGPDLYKLVCRANYTCFGWHDTLDQLADLSRAFSRRPTLLTGALCGIKMLIQNDIEKKRERLNHTERAFSIIDRATHLFVR